MTVVNAFPKPKTAVPAFLATMFSDPGWQRVGRYLYFKEIDGQKVGVVLATMSPRWDDFALNKGEYERVLNGKREGRLDQTYMVAAKIDGAKFEYVGAMEAEELLPKLKDLPVITGPTGSSGRCLSGCSWTRTTCRSNPINNERGFTMKLKDDDSLKVLSPDAVKIICGRIASVADGLVDSWSARHDPLKVGEFATNQIIELCKLLLEAAQHDPLRFQLAEVERGILAKLAEIDPGWDGDLELEE